MIINDTTNTEIINDNDTDIELILNYFKSLPVVTDDELNFDDNASDLMLGFNNFIEDGMNRLYDEGLTYIAIRIFNNIKQRDPDSYLFKVNKDHSFSSYIYAITDYMNHRRVAGDKFELGMLKYDDSGFSYMSILTEDVDDEEYEFIDDDAYQLTENFSGYLIENKLVPENLYL